MRERAKGKGGKRMESETFVAASCDLLEPTHSTRVEQKQHHYWGTRQDDQVSGFSQIKRDAVIIGLSKNGDAQTGSEKSG